MYLYAEWPQSPAAKETAIKDRDYPDSIVAGVRRSGVHGMGLVSDGGGLVEHLPVTPIWKQ